MTEGPPDRTPPPPPQPPAGGPQQPISVETVLLLLLITGLATAAAINWPNVGAGIAVGAAVLAVLLVLIGRPDI